MFVVSLCVCVPGKASQLADYGSDLHDALRAVTRSAAAAMNGLAQFHDGAKLIAYHGQRMFETVNSPIMPTP
jgi:hypothetical protein